VPLLTPTILSSNNERLPYDVLGLVFYQYTLISSNYGTIKHEALLLVCRAWLFAAVGHRMLWSRMEMWIHGLKALPCWKIQVRLRLSKSSPTALLDVVPSMYGLKPNVTSDEIL
jgi:hypothetical protein